MLYDAIDHVILPVPDPDTAAEPFRRLGLTLSGGTRHRGRGTRNRSFFVGEPASPFYVELLGIADREEALRVRGAAFVEAMERGSGLRSVLLRTSDLAAAVAELRRRGAPYETAEVHDDAGTKIADTAWSPDPGPAVVDVHLVQHPADAAQRRAARMASEGLLSHAFPLKRLDHLAAVAPGLRPAPRNRAFLRGSTATDEVGTRARISRQFRIGDEMME